MSSSIAVVFRFPNLTLLSLGKHRQEGIPDGTGKKDGDNFKIENLVQKEVLKNGDYFILYKTFDEIQKMISEKKYFLLRENLYKVTMISATSFNIQFRKHYAAKSKEENKNITSSDLWFEAKPIKVEVDRLGNIKLIAPAEADAVPQ